MTTSAAVVRFDSGRETVEAVRAREPDRCGYAVQSGVRIYYEVFGSGPTTILLLPPWAIVDSRTWKLQVPYLARHFRVVTYDPRGNGRSDRPVAPENYADTELLADAIAVMDATETSSAVCVGFSVGGRILLELAAGHPERVDGAVFVAAHIRLHAELRQRGPNPFEQQLDTDEGWAKFNVHYWRKDLPGFAEFFFGEVFVEPHSSKQIEDGVGWALASGAETLIATQRAPLLGRRQADGPPAAAETAARVLCPSLVIHGDDDRVVDVRTGLALAEILGCPVEIFAGGGHCVQARHPVRFNLVLRQFVQSVSGVS